MWQGITNIVKSAAAFLQVGKAPPNTPANLKQEMENTNHMASKKFFVAITAFVALILFHAASVFVLFLMIPFPAIVSAYVILFSKTVEIIGVVVAFYLTGQAAVDLRYNSSSNASYEGVNIVEENIYRSERLDPKDIPEVDMID
jgi:hypothetical protein